MKPMTMIMMLLLPAEEGFSSTALEMSKNEVLDNDYDAFSLCRRGFLLNSTKKEDFSSTVMKRRIQLKCFVDCKGILASLYQGRYSK